MTHRFGIVGSGMIAPIHLEAIRERFLALPGPGIGASNPSAGLDCAGHKAVFAEFLAALESGGPPPIDGSEARKAVSIVLAIYESARLGGAPVRPR